MAIAKNHVFHARTKHIEIQDHYVRELIKDGVIELEYCPTEDNCANIFTKALGNDLLVRLLKMSNGDNEEAQMKNCLLE